MYDMLDLVAAGGNLFVQKIIWRHASETMKAHFHCSYSEMLELKIVIVDLQEPEATSCSAQRNTLLHERTYNVYAPVAVALQANPMNGHWKRWNKLIEYHSVLLETHVWNDKAPTRAALRPDI